MHNHLKRRAKKKNENIKQFTLKENDKVLIKALNVSNESENQVAKFFNVYEGLHIIKSKVAYDTYVIMDETGKEKGKFHLRYIKPFVQ